MKAAKKKRLQTEGWRFGGAAEFMGLSAEERAVLALKAELGRKLRNKRVERNWTQSHFAQVVRSSQSRVAKMESGDPSVSLDLLVKSLLAVGLTWKDLALVIGKEPAMGGRQSG